MHRFFGLLLTLLLAVSSAACSALYRTAEAPGPSSGDTSDAPQQTEAPKATSEPSPQKPTPTPPKKTATPKEPPKTENTPRLPAEKPSVSRKTSETAVKSSSNSETPAYEMNEFEREVVRLVNEEREKKGLKPLQVDPKAAELARKKADDMRKNHYFSHQSPTYGSPFDMLRQAGISFLLAGENIAAGQRSPEQVMDSWMNSEGHRANILNPGYALIGVGYVAGGDYGSYWTQIFLTR